MSSSKGSKIALAVAGLILVAGAATAIAMTQKNGGPSLPLIGTEESAPSKKTESILPDVPAAETGELPLKDRQTTPDPLAGESVPGMKNLDQLPENTTGSVFDAPDRESK